MRRTSKPLQDRRQRAGALVADACRDCRSRRRGQARRLVVTSSGSIRRRRGLESARARRRKVFLEERHSGCYNCAMMGVFNTTDTVVYQTCIVKQLAGRDMIYLRAPVSASAVQDQDSNGRGYDGWARMDGTPASVRTLQLTLLPPTIRMRGEKGGRGMRATAVVYDCAISESDHRRPRHAQRRRDQPAAQSGQNDRAGHGVAGENHQGSVAGRP